MYCLSDRLTVSEVLVHGAQGFGESAEVRLELSLDYGREMTDMNSP